LKSVWTNSSQDPVLKKPSQKRIGGVTQDVGPVPEKIICSNLHNEQEENS
jgi:hypothetical protein